MHNALLVCSPITQYMYVTDHPASATQTQHVSLVGTVQPPPPTSSSSLSESNRGTVVIMVVHDVSDIVLFASCFVFLTITPFALHTHITLVLSQIAPHTLIPMDLLEL